MKTWLAVPVLICLLPISAGAEVVSRNQGGQEAAAKAQSLLRQMSLEKDLLQEANDRLKEDVAKRDKQNAELKAALERYKKEAESVRRKNESLSTEVDRGKAAMDQTKEVVGRYQEVVGAQRERMEDMRTKFQSLVDKYKELVGALKLVEAERVRLAEQGDEQLRVLEDCAGKNHALYQANLEILEQYHQKGVWDALLQKEPVTQLKQAEIENLIEEMQYKLNKLKMPVMLQTAEK
jgi:chromosome segregation ATPase